MDITEMVLTLFPTGHRVFTHSTVQLTFIELFDGFRVYRYETRLQQVPQRHKSTLQWFLNSSTYNKWLKDSGFHLLAVSGHPGCGKTVLSGFLIKTLKNLVASSTDSFVTYSFCGGGVAAQKTANGILRTLILQFLIHKPSSSLPQVSPFYNTMGKMLFESLDTLWEVFVAVVTAMTGTVFCIIDGLDECEKESRDFIFDKVQELFSSETLPGRSLKMLVTFRPAYDIEAIIFPWKFLVRIKMDESPSVLKRDVDAVVEEKVREYCMFRNISESLQLKIREILQRKANGTFLWVDLVIQGLMRGDIGSSEESIMKHIDGFPDNLEGVYYALFKAIDRRRIEDARRILTWVTLASKPLTLTELGIALAVRLEDNSIEAVNERKYFSIRLELLRVVGTFVRILGEEVHMVHQSAKEFLLGSGSQIAVQFDQRLWISIPDGHSELAHTCLKYGILALNEIQTANTSIGI
jgi:ankyrin repeat domain-containing protein 50